MGKVFSEQRAFNSYTKKYSWDNWNEAVEKHGDNPREMKILTHLVMGNFARLMIDLLEFIPEEGSTQWVSSKPRTQI